MELAIVVVYLAFAAVVALVARSQGRSPVTWFGLSLLLTPLLAFIAVALTPSPNDQAQT